MIFTDASVNEWLRKYPELKIITGNCDHCGAPMRTTRPFVTRDYAGLIAHDCSCGQNRHTALSLVTTTQKKNAEWAEVLSGT